MNIINKVITFFKNLFNRKKKEVKTYTRRTYTISELELDLIQRINTYRMDMGLNVLNFLSPISAVCKDSNDNMIATGLISHNGFTTREEELKSVLNAKAVYENIAYNYKTNEQILNTWIASKSHNDNLLADVTHVGVSITTNENGKPFITCILCKV